MKKQICAGGFIVHENKFLFGKRSSKKKWAPCCWDIPGGRSLKNEHPLFTLRRELKEETGIIVMDAQLLTTIEVPDRNKSFICHIYGVLSYKGKPVNLTKEHTKLRWFSREQLDTVELALASYPGLIDAWHRV